MISVDDHLLPQNIMFPLLEIMHDEVHLLVIGGISLDNIKKFLAVIGHQMSLMSEEHINSIVRGIYLNIKWLL